jgi:hypothetical protein
MMPGPCHPWMLHRPAPDTHNQILQNCIRFAHSVACAAAPSFSCYCCALSQHLRRRGGVISSGGSPRHLPISHDAAAMLAVLQSGQLVLLPPGSTSATVARGSQAEGTGRLAGEATSAQGMGNCRGRGSSSQHLGVIERLFLDDNSGSDSEDGGGSDVETGIQTWHTASSSALPLPSPDIARRRTQRMLPEILSQLQIALREQVTANALERPVSWHRSPSVAAPAPCVCAL